MAKRANDKIMTKLQLRGVLVSPYLACVLSWSGEGKCPVGSRGKALVEGLDWGQSLQKLKRYF